MKIIANPKCCSLVLLAFFFSSAIANAFSPQLTKHLQELQAAIEKEINHQVAEIHKSHEEEDPRQVRAYFAGTLRSAIAHNRAEELDMVLNEIDGAVTTEATRRLSAKVHAELKIEIEKNNAAAVARVEAKLTNAAKALRAATKPADLDAILRNLSVQDQPESDFYGPRLAMERSKIESANQFVRYWQDYLAAIESKDTKTALQRLESASGIKVDLIPRSEILNRLTELKKIKGVTPVELITQVMNRTKSLDAIPTALDELSGFEREQWNINRDYDATVAFLRGELTAISATYQQIKLGVPTSYTVHRPGNQPNELDPIRLTQELRVQLLQLILPRVIGGGADVEVQPGETIQAYLDRVLALGSDRLDARMILRVRELQNTLRGDRQIDLTPLQPFLAAQNQDAAEQYAAAVVSYQIALKNGGDLIPARQIGARLEAIKASHPAEYAAGMDQFVKNPPSYPPRSSYNSGSIEIPGAVSR
jgi:hypothetical protein